MLKVECESCKAPYQIDERRVPAAGLKMRCPKCGHSFVVKNPSAAAAPEPASAASKPQTPTVAPRIAPRSPAMARPAPPVPAPAAIKPAAPQAKPSIPAALGGPEVDLPAVAADLPSPAARPAGPAVQKRTMMGVAGPATTPGGPRVVKLGAPTIVGAVPPPPAKPDFDLGLDGPDFADLPSPAADLPSPAKTAAARPAPRVAPKQTMAFGADPFGEADLPSPALSDLPSPAQSNLPSRALSDLPSAAVTDLPSPATNVGLPSPANVGYPSPAARQPVAPRRGTVAFGEIDLPTAAQDLPAVASALPSVANALPSVAQALPSVAQSLPSVAQSLPSVAQSLPVAMPNAGDDFGELELPRAPMSDRAGPKPFSDEAFGDPSPAPRAAAPVTSLFDENPFSSVAPPRTGSQSDAGGGGGFGDLELPVPPRESRGQSFADRAPQSERGSAGGMAFGELDLGGGATPSQIPGGSLSDNPFGEASLGSVIQPPPAPAGMEVSRVSAFGSVEAESRTSGAEGYGAPADASIDTSVARPRRERAEAAPREPLPILRILGALLAVIVVAGVGATFTRFGPFGWHFFFDTMHAAEYAGLANTAVQEMHPAFASDMFDDARAVSDKLAAERAAKPRARALTAVAAIAEFETELRFGKDPDRANRAKLWLTSEIPEPRTPDKVRYLDVAQAAGAALDRDRDKARSGFEAAARKYGTDPIQQDVAFLRGELELRSGDGAAAVAAFRRALELAPGARAHFGLARAAYLQGDLKTAWTELGATIAAAPKHGAALLLRAEMAWSQGRDDAAARSALKDIATLLEGPARNSISTSDQAQAYAVRGMIQFARGRTGEARAAYDDALKVDQRNTTALIGQGDVLYDEGRLTEALSRYDTAKQVDPASVPAIVGDAKTQIGLERLADAKTQLGGAVQKFPKSALARQWYATAESALGDKKSAEKDYLAAIDLIDPTDPEAIEPYAAYASFLNAQGRGDEAKAKLAEAQHKLPDSIALQRTLGDVGIVQGNFADAVSHFRAALQMDGEDVSSRFKLGRALRLANQLDEAAKVFDAVYAADKSFPGLSLERGQLFEQSGDVQKALEQFKTALDAHPNDPDLMLRVGASYVAIGQGEKAEPLLRDVLKQRPNSAEAEHYLGRALMLEGPLHQQEAMRHLQTAVNRDANRAEFHLYVGWLANELSPPDLGLARKEIDRALELDQTIPDAYWQKGIYEYFGGQLDSAVKDLQRALQLKPTRFEAHATLAQVYDQKNMPDASLAEWRLAIAHKDDDEFWNYRYGSQLMDRGMMKEAAARLKAATEAAEQDQPRPRWLQTAEYPCAEALQRVGDVKGACDHYAKFLQQADQNNPDRVDALHKCQAVCGHSCTE